MPHYSDHNEPSIHSAEYAHLYRRVVEILSASGLSTEFALDATNTIASMPNWQTLTEQALGGLVRQRARWNMDSEQRKAHRRRTILKATNHDPADTNPTKLPSDDAIYKEALEKLSDIVALLDEDDFLILRLRIVNGLAFQEIAMQLAMPISTVRRKYIRVLNSLVVAMRGTV